MSRTAKVERITKETSVVLTLDLDGEGRADLDIPVPFLTHMLDLFSRHGQFDLTITATGDVDIDDHHTVEDIGLCLGKALRDALGDKGGIARYGTSYVPMDEALVRTVIDLSGRPYLAYDLKLNRDKVGRFDLELVEEFLRALTNQGGITLHLDSIRGTNAHHIVEATFKGLGRALAQAVKVTDLSRKIPSTKGSLDG